MTSKKTKLLKKSIATGRPLTFEEWQREILRCEGIETTGVNMGQSIREKIEERLDDLDRMMRSNVHLQDTKSVGDQIQLISKFWSSLSDADRDYLNAVRHAVLGFLPWNSTDMQ